MTDEQRTPGIIPQAIVAYSHPDFKAPIKGEVVSVNNGKAYVHFFLDDRRFDNWIPVSQLSVKHGPQSRSPSYGHKSRGSSSIEAEKNRIREVDSIQIGSNLIEAWYFSPYPREFTVNRKLFICEYCLKYFPTIEDLQAHISEVKEVTPPGKEIYREGNISVFEVKATKQKLYCQCLCLLGKLFIDHKNLFYDLDNFNFYVLCECDGAGAHFAAYFSREVIRQQNVLACIAVLPPYQSKGYGQFLISMSYEIAKRSHNIGGPERPLSDLGRLAFMKYWKNTCISLLKTYKFLISSLEQLSVMTSITQNDIVDSLMDADLLIQNEKDGSFLINYEAIDSAYLKNRKGIERALTVRPEFLSWEGKKKIGKGTKELYGE